MPSGFVQAAILRQECLTGLRPADADGFMGASVAQRAMAIEIGMGALRGITADPPAPPQPPSPKKGASSAAIGVSGEAFVLEILSMAAGPTIAGHMGDLQIRCGGANFYAGSGRKVIVVEVKKYARTVPTTERAKFYEDCESVSGVVGGMFVSLESPIALMPRFHIEWLALPAGRRVPLVFMSSGCRDTIAFGYKACLELAGAASTARVSCSNDRLSAETALAGARDSIRTVATARAKVAACLIRAERALVACATRLEPEDSDNSDSDSRGGSESPSDTESS